MAGDGGHGERERFFAAAKVVSSLTVLSRILGLVRDMAITSLGASRMTSAFVLAFKVPNLFRRLFGEGALSAAFVPVFTEALEAGDRSRAVGLLANVLGLLAVLLVALMAAIQLGLLAWTLISPGEWDRRLVFGLTAVMLPFMVTVCLLALGSAALNCRGHFAFPAFAPILLNVFIIAAAWGSKPLLAGDVPGRLYAIAAAVSAAGVAQLVGVLWLLRRSGLLARPRLRPLDPAVGPMFRRMVPMLVGLGFLQVCELLFGVVGWLLEATEASPTIHLAGRELAKPLTAGVLMRLYPAQRLYQLPMGVLAISLGVVIFPLLSRYAARDDRPAMAEAVNRALRLAVMEGLAAGVGLFMLAGPILRLIFVRGRFTAADAGQSAFILRMYVLGLWAYCGQVILTRAFYALKDVRTPLVLASAMTVLSLAAVVALVWVPAVGAGAFGLATAAAAAVNVVLLTWLLRRRLGPFGGRRLAVSVLRSAAACGVMAGGIWLMRTHLLAGRPDWLVVAACVPAGAAVFLAAAAAMRAPELGEMFRRHVAEAEVRQR
jgi:putative peptidoglycan lipid II flippase